MRTRSRFLFFGMMVLGVVLGLFLSSGLQGVLSPAPSPAVPLPVAAAQAVDRAAAEPTGLDAEERHTIALFKDVARSVAFITTQVEQVDLWTRSVAEVPAGTGSGFVWDAQGHVVTNFHVVQSGETAKVTVGVNEYPAKLVGYSREQDLAVLRIDAARAKLVPIRVGTSADVQVGQKVYAIGNPFGLDYSLTKGIVSALGRTIESVGNTTIFDVIQTDAAINPGNSGGPLLDSTGRLIGVNTAIYSPSGASAGIGFAVPVDTVSRIIPGADRERPRRAPDPRRRPRRRPGERLRRAAARSRGRARGQVFRGGGAAEAGVQPTGKDRTGGTVIGDIILEIDGKPVRSRSDIRKVASGATSRATWSR